MNPERWKQIDELLDVALELEPDKRSAFLDEACAGDEALRKEVEKFVDSDKQEKSWIEGSALQVASEFLTEPQTSRLFPGQSIGPYQILSLLGTGGMGEVYRARDQRLERDVAIKVLPESVAKDSHAMARFDREEKALAALSHPNILAIYDVGDHEGIVFAVMELLKGETLRSYLAGTKCTWEKAVTVGACVVDGLSAAHSQGVIHRDLKPENIFLTSDGGVKILDFGLVHREKTPPVGELMSPVTESQLTQDGILMGTVPYMSPEQAHGKELDARTDLFSLGVVLYEMATGTLPFGGKSTAEKLEAILTQEPVEPVRLNPKVPAKLEEIIAKAMKKDRNLRYQNAADMKTDLQQLNPNTSLSSAERATFPGTATATTEGWLTKGRMWIAAAAMFVVLLAVTIFFFGRETTAPETKETAIPAEPGKTAIAVLPFVNLSKDEDQEYFSDGLTEVLMDVLTKNPKLRVTSRTSAFSFKGKEVDIKTIAEKLSVTHVLEGSVRKEGNELRITTQLIEVATDSHLWSQTYDRQMENIFAVQDDIAASVAGALKATLEGGPAPKAQQTNPEAYNAYLQGRYFLDRWSKEDYEKAIGYFEQALQIDRNYARAWIGLSEAHHRQGDWGYVPVDEGYGKARKEVEKALELDPNLAEAHARMGWIKMSYDWDWNAADAAYRRALELEPANADVVGGAALLAGALGRFDEAIALGRRAIELDPLKVETHFNLGFHAYQVGRWEDAEAAFRKVLELNPQYAAAHVNLGRIYLIQSKLEAALVEMKKELEPAWRDYGLALAYHAAGNEKEADAALAEYIEKYQNEAAFQIAEICAYRGETDKAFEWLDRASRQHDGGLPETKGDPLLRSLERDPRYPVFLKKMKLPVD